MLNTALDNLKNETSRSALRIEPVSSQGDELYHILRTRLFETLPDEPVRTPGGQRLRNGRQGRARDGRHQPFAGFVRRAAGRVLSRSTSGCATCTPASRRTPASSRRAA